MRPGEAEQTVQVAICTPVPTRAGKESFSLLFRLQTPGKVFLALPLSPVAWGPPSLSLVRVQGLFLHQDLSWAQVSDVHPST